MLTEEEVKEFYDRRVMSWHIPEDCGNVFQWFESGEFHEAYAAVFEHFVVAGAIKLHADFFREDYERPLSENEREEAGQRDFEYDQYFKADPGIFRYSMERLNSALDIYHLVEASIDWLEGFYLPTTGQNLPSPRTNSFCRWLVVELADNEVLRDEFLSRKWAVSEGTMTDNVSHEEAFAALARCRVRWDAESECRRKNGNTAD